MPPIEDGRERPIVTPGLVGLFFAVASLVCAAAGLSLLSPGGPLEGMWRFKPAEYQQLLRMGPVVAGGFLVLAALMVLASVGSFQRRRWGPGLAIAIFVLNALGDAARIPSGAVAEGLLGVAVTGAIVWWLTRPRVRRLFDR